MDWKGKRVLVTGGTGFLGRAVGKKLRQQHADVLAVGSSDCNLCNRLETHNFFSSYEPHIVIHCAVQGGGIGWMKKYPVQSGIDNVRMNINVLEAAQACGAEGFIGVSSACAYPKFCPIPFTEKDLWEGYPEPTNGSYALSKRIMMDLGRAYYQQYNFHSVFPILANLYGPEDHLSPERAHVVADLMMRCARKPSSLILWGTGTPTREFLYIDDAAEGVLATIRGTSGSMINIGTGVETSILELAKEILQGFDLHIPIRFDASRPDGQPRKVLSVAKARQELGWQAKTSLRNGLQKTIEWYKLQIQ